MKERYREWKSLYPKRGSGSGKVDKRLRLIIQQMKEDLNGILDFIQAIGLNLDDHYIEIRNSVDRA
jgi:hypothetical protein